MVLNNWSDATIGSVSRMNKISVIEGTGDELDALDKSQYSLLKCTADGSGFLLDHLYLCLGDGTGVIDLSVVADHQHTGVADDGGSFITAFGGSPEQLDTGARFLFNLRLTDWKRVESGTASASEITNHANWPDSQAVLKMSTGATSGSGANLKLGGLDHDYTKESYFIMATSVSSLTDIATHWGWNMDNITSADGNGNKYGLTTCTATNGNWFIRSADGTAHSETDTGIAFTTNDTNILARHSPTGTPSVEALIDGVLAGTKTTDIPTTGTGGDRANIIRACVKNNSANNKDAYLYKMRFGYWVDDGGFFG